MPITTHLPLLRTFMRRTFIDISLFDVECVKACFYPCEMCFLQTNIPGGWTHLLVCNPSIILFLFFAHFCRGSLPQDDWKESNSHDVCWWDGSHTPFPRCLGGRGDATNSPQVFLGRTPPYVWQATYHTRTPATPPPTALAARWLATVVPAAGSTLPTRCADTSGRQHAVRTRDETNAVFS